MRGMKEEYWMRSTLKSVLVCFAAFGWATAAGNLSASAQTAETGIALELNVLQSTDAGCRVGFLLENKHSSDVEKLEIEAVIFNAEDLIDRLLILEFGTVAASASKVRLFQLPDLQCDQVSRVLLNEVIACDGAALDASTCERSMELSNRTAIKFGR